MTWNEYLQQWAENHGDLIADSDIDSLYENMGIKDDLPAQEIFLEEIFRYTITEIGLSKYEFTKQFVDDIVYHVSDYSKPMDFFKDLAHGGCISGMIGSLIYNSDCKKIYIEHIDSMEDFVLDEEEELGEPIQNRNKLPRYVFVCWLCFEEMCYKIARELFPEEF